MAPASEFIIGEKPPPSPRSFSPKHLSKQLLNLLRPSIFTKTPKRDIHPTSYLNGLRGFAALLVYFHHHQVWARVHPSTSSLHIMENVFGYNNQHYFATLPIVRLFFSGGHFAVAIFFVISGHVLSAKPLAFIQSNQMIKMEDSISSAMFRRWLRLYLPVFGTTFLYMTCWHVFGVFATYPDHQSTWLGEVKAWYKESREFSFVFGYAYTAGKVPPWTPRYNFHLWTIPVEFRGSITVFMSLLAFSRASRNMRLLCEVVLIWNFVWFMEDAVFLGMFVGGMLICDLELLAKAKRLPDFVSRLEQYKMRIVYGAMVVCVWLSNVPTSDSELETFQKSPGWYYLSYLRSSAITDFKWFYLFFASTLFITILPHLRFLRSFFELRFPQYLGRISFALYMVHGPIIWTFCDRVYAAAGWPRQEQAEDAKKWMDVFPIPNIGPLGLELSFLVPQLLILPVTLWAAEVTTKVFDAPSIRFSRWFYRKTLQSSNGL